MLGLFWFKSLWNVGRPATVANQEEQGSQKGADMTIWTILVLVMTTSHLITGDVELESSLFSITQSLK